MWIAVGHLEVFNDLALVPDVISGGHHVDPQIEKLFRQGRRDSEASRGIFAVGDDQVGGVLLAQFGQAIFYDRSPRTAKNVTDKKNFQESDLRNNAARRAGQTSMVPENCAVARWPISRALQVLATGYWQLATGY
jgi:hypothetical protein